jgi:hypothetical protein
MVRPGGGLNEALEIIAGAATAAGRDPAAILFEGRIDYLPGNPDKMAHHAARWRESGAASISLNTMRAGLSGPDDHIAALTTVAELLR